MKQSLIHIRMKQSLVCIGWNKIWYRMKQNLDLRWKKSFCVLWCCVVSCPLTRHMCRVISIDTTRHMCRVMSYWYDTTHLDSLLNRMAKNRWFLEGFSIKTEPRTYRTSSLSPKTEPRTYRTSKNRTEPWTEPGSTQHYYSKFSWNFSLLLVVFLFSFL